MQDLRRAFYEGGPDTQEDANESVPPHTDA